MTMSKDALDDAAETFLGIRDRLFGIAYRILGDCGDAEDIVQEAWLRWQACDRDVIVDPAAFLATITRRLCINAMNSARARHETCVGPWLPERADNEGDPQIRIERLEALELITATLLERLSPTERAAYVLREAFGYSYADIAGIVAVTAPNARQLVSRARKHLTTDRRGPACPVEHKRLLGALAAASQTGDLATLEYVFAEDVAPAA
jgi:RNA polymerase sigma-70 factor, ECF subfamily